MRKIILGLGISIDGYIARLDGTFDFLFMPKDFSMAEFFKSIDTGIMGRKTYDVAKAQGEGGFGQKLKTYVFSRTLPPGEREGNTFVNVSPQALVDELHLGVVPVLLGEGLPLFPSAFPQRNFELMENKSFSRGLISLKYKRVRHTGKKKL
jgi:dihydrofolate reductase